MLYRFISYILPETQSVCTLAFEFNYETLVVSGCDLVNQYFPKIGLTPDHMISVSTIGGLDIEPDVWRVIKLDGSIVKPRD